jgi:hypothetical protein
MPVTGPDSSLGYGSVTGSNQGRGMLGKETLRRKVYEPVQQAIMLAVFAVIIAVIGLMAAVRRAH